MEHPIGVRAGGAKTWAEKHPKIAARLRKLTKKLITKQVKHGTT